MSDNNSRGSISFVISWAELLYLIPFNECEKLLPLNQRCFLVVFISIDEHSFEDLVFMLELVDHTYRSV